MVGGGQLARMTHQAAIDLDVELVVLAASDDDPAILAGATALVGSPADPSALARLAERVDVVTFDHEHVPAALAVELSRAGACVYPRGEALLVAQDKLVARETFERAGLPVPAFAALGPAARPTLESFAAEHGWPVVVKARRGGYDGRGVAVVHDAHRPEELLDRLPGDALLVEARVDIVQELAVVGVRSPSGAWASYPLVATVQHDGICRELVMPAVVDDALARRAEELARSVADLIDAAGIVAVELFVTARGDIVLNEIALRPHNSGHATIEAAATSQFHNHLRAVLDWPLGDTTLRAPAAAMVNVLGAADGSDPRARLGDALSVAGAAVHLYGKAPAPGRKLGHVTALGDSAEDALDTARRCAALLSASVGESGEELADPVRLLEGMTHR
jgi:5-(carboxyamino)imidazole ribonucleotide synthase